MQRGSSLVHLSQAFSGMLHPQGMPGCNQALLSLQQWAQLYVACDMDAQSAWQGRQSFHSSPSLANFITLNTISDNPGAKHQGRRLGRGIGSSKGKTSGRGHKGQKARTGRSPKEGFEGGQTPLRIRVGKRGFTNPFQQDLRVVNLDALAERIKQSRLDTSSLITMKSLQGAGLIDTKADRGVKLLGRGANALKQPVHIQVSQASQKAKEAVEAAGGSVTTVYYNPLGLRALLKPDWFAKKGRLMPQAARPPPKLAHKFDRVGQLPVPSSLPTTPEGTAVP